MRETDLRRLIADEFLSVIQDPRVERTRKHPLQTILVIALLAVICGADSIVDIENYAKSRKQWLETFLDTLNKVEPAPATETGPLAAVG